MALEYKVESLDGLDESVKGFYEESESGFVLSVAGLPEQEDVSGLKNKANDLLSEKKKLKDKFNALETEFNALKSKQDNNSTSKKEDDRLATLEAQLSDALGRLDEKDNMITSMQQAQTKKDLREIAYKAARDETSDANRADLLAEKIESRIKIEDGKPCVLDENGNPTISTVEELTKSIIDIYPFLRDGKGSTGGGSLGNRNASGMDNGSKNEQAEKAKSRGDTHGFLAAKMKENLNKKD